MKSQSPMYYFFRGGVQLLFLSPELVKSSGPIFFLVGVVGGDGCLLTLLPNFCISRGIHFRYSMVPPAGTIIYTTIKMS